MDVIGEWDADNTDSEERDRKPDKRTRIAHTDRKR
jgi:hypothetical protein